MKLFNSLFLSLVFLCFCGLFLHQNSVLPAEAQSQPKVEVFVADWCPFCQALEKFLKAEKIRYKRYDIEKSSKGKRIYKSLGMRGVPVTRIGGSQIVSGFKPDVIYQSVKGKKLGP